MDSTNNPHEGKKVAVLAAMAAGGQTGGAERFYEALVAALRKLGAVAEIVPVHADESTFEKIMDNYRHCAAMDLSHFDMVISTKAPTFAARHPRHVLYLVHTIRVFYDMFSKAFPASTEFQRSQQEAILSLDRKAFELIPHRFAIGHEVARRLKKWNGVSAEVLHPPLSINQFRKTSTGNYFFIPGRLHSWKRVDLAIRAVRQSERPIRLLIAGTGEAEIHLRELAGDDARIEFLGRVTDEQLVEYYARSLAVLFVPVREDYGYITLEAFASGKPVITCTDSGEPLQFVEDGVSGFVCDPDPGALCNTMEWLWANPDIASEMGERGYETIQDMSWDEVARQLLDVGLGAVTESVSQTPVVQRPVHTSILDMQPISPPIGGGRLRLLGLYHGLANSVMARYVGTFDWPGEPYRQHWLSPTLEEIDVPLSHEHHQAAAKLARQSGDKVVIDLAFPRLGVLSPDYIETAIDTIHWSDVTVFSHPWIYPLVGDRIPDDQSVVYDSQNVEGILRGQLLNLKNPVEVQLLHEVVAAEAELCARADLVLACSHTDAKFFTEIYDVPPEKIRVVPNGVMTSKLKPANEQSKRASRNAIGIAESGIFVIFLGSNYQPNVDGANFVIRELAPRLPDVTFVIAGGVGERAATPVSGNVLVTGMLSDEQKTQWLQAADFALNPMFSGSGTNIKMFDFMAAGLPIVTTEIGARGIDTAGLDPFQVSAPTVDSLSNAISTLISDRSQYARQKKAVRLCVEEGYSWENISFHLGAMLNKLYRTRPRKKPYFSVVIPTYERHRDLDQLMCSLEAQVERDFEVVIVDQSEDPWPNRHRSRDFPIEYFHTSVKGAARARNTGASLTNGHALAFTDDDCRPDPDWLYAAKRHLRANNIAGIEGLIYSDHIGDARFRQVSNVGFHGLGFMTANLFVRARHFFQLGGFDLQFDKPHFREDTDLGWRLQQLGEVPYADDVKVFHPAKLREVARESSEERARFFEKDALLLAKHPDRFEQLFRFEAHWKNTPGYWNNFERGAKKYGIDISSYLEFRDKQVES